MPRYLCQICHFATPLMGYIANVLTLYLNCTQGVRWAPYRIECPVFMREPGPPDDEWPGVRLRGSSPTRYPMIEARG